MSKSVALILVIGAMFDTVAVDVFVALDKFFKIFTSWLRGARNKLVPQMAPLQGAGTPAISDAEGVAPPGDL